MSSLLQPAHRLVVQLREHGPALLAGLPEPHDELMSLVWGPRFDREHALGLVAQRPAGAARALPALLAAADAFDALRLPAQQRLRDLIRRHRALSAVAAGGAWPQARAAVHRPPADSATPDWGMADEEAGAPWKATGVVQRVAPGVTAPVAATAV